MPSCGHTVILPILVQSTCPKTLSLIFFFNCLYTILSLPPPYIYRKLHTQVFHNQNKSLFIILFLHNSFLWFKASYTPNLQMASPIPFFGLLAFIFIAALASDPSPLQDFCVADTNSQGTKWALNMHTSTPYRLNVKTISSSSINICSNSFFTRSYHNIHNCTHNVCIF